MAVSKIPDTNTHRIGITGQWPAIGRGDGDITITVPLQGNFSSVSLNKTTNISVSIYGMKAYGSITCSYDPQGSIIQNSYMYLRFHPSTSYSGYTDVGKPCVINFENGLVATLS